MAEQRFSGLNWTAVHKDSPPRILIRTGAKIVGYIDVRTGEQKTATKEELIALGVNPQLVEDVEAKP